MIPSLSIGPRTLLNDCNHSATAISWRSAIQSFKSASERSLSPIWNSFATVGVRDFREDGCISRSANEWAGPSVRTGRTAKYSNYSIMCCSFI